MRLRLRILGADVFDLATGRDARDETDVEQGPGALSADLTAAPPPFGLTGHDQPYTLPEERKR